MSAQVKEVATPSESPDWYDLLQDALSEPGYIRTAYSLFHKYSLCNRLLASKQLRDQGLPLTPINTFKGWLSAERPVMKGEKAAISLVMPIVIKKPKVDDDGHETQSAFTLFKPKRAWFHLGQTDGADYVVEQKSPNWDLELAKSFLELEEFDFASVDGSLPVLIRGRSFAVSPIEALPVKARFRAMGAIVLGHSAPADSKDARNVPIEKELRDVEAETVAYLCCATLGFDGLEDSRAQLQRLLAGRDAIPDKVAQRAFSAADKLLNAGLC